MNLKKKTFKAGFCTLICTGSLLNGCSKPTQIAPPTPISGAQKGNILNFPSSWTMTDIEGFTAASVAPLEDQNDMFKENVVLQTFHYPKPLRLDDFYKKEFDPKTAKKVLEKFQLIEVKEKHLGRFLAKRLVIEHYSDGRVLKCLVYAVIDNTNGYIMTCSAEKTHFDQYLNKFEKICGSFEPSS